MLSNTDARIRPQNPRSVGTDRSTINHLQPTFTMRYPYLQGGRSIYAEKNYLALNLTLITYR